MSKDNNITFKQGVLTISISFILIMMLVALFHSFIDLNIEKEVVFFDISAHCSIIISWYLAKKL